MQRYCADGPERTGRALPCLATCCHRIFGWHADSLKAVLEEVDHVDADTDSHGGAWRTGVLQVNHHSVVVVKHCVAVAASKEQSARQPVESCR